MLSCTISETSVRDC